MSAVAAAPAGAAGSDLAYLLYTSGTTGTPKAVMVERAHAESERLRTRLDALGPQASSRRRLWGRLQKHLHLTRPAGLEAA